MFIEFYFNIEQECLKCVFYFKLLISYKKTGATENVNVRKV